jgi:hypothetical protein
VALLPSAKDTQDGYRQTPIQVLQEKSQNMYIGREEELFFKDEALLFIEAIQYNNQDFCCTTSTAATRGTIAG